MTNRLYVTVPLAVAFVAVGCGSDTDRGESVTDFDPAKIEVAYSWLGLSPARGYEFSGDCTADECAVSVTCYDNGDSSPDRRVQLPPATIDTGLVRDFTATFDDLDPIDEPTEAIDHTDDYPDLTVTLTNSDGETATFSTSSNTRDRTPWNVEFAGTLSASHDPTSTEKYGDLRDATDATDCWD